MHAAVAQLTNLSIFVSSRLADDCCNTVNLIVTCPHRPSSSPLRHARHGPLPRPSLIPRVFPRRFLTPLPSLLSVPWSFLCVLPGLNIWHWVPPGLLVTLIHYFCWCGGCGAICCDPPPRLPFLRSVSMPVRYTAGVSALLYSPRNIFRFYFFCFAL